jgi:hypothetical protein
MADVRKVNKRGTKMRKQLLLLAALLSVAGRGFASDITINLDAPFQMVQPGDLITFTGTIVNNDPAIVDLNFIEVDLSGTEFSVDDSPFFIGPPTVGASTGLPLTQTIDFEMFDVMAAGDAPPGRSTGTVTILGGAEGPGGYDSTTQNVLGSATFQITVAPEPSTFAITFIAIGALYLLRRRRNNVRRRRVQA